MNIVQYAVYKLTALLGAVVFCQVYIFVDSNLGRKAISYVPFVDIDDWDDVDTSD